MNVVMMKFLRGRKRLKSSKCINTFVRWCTYHLGTLKRKKKDWSFEKTISGNVTQFHSNDVLLFKNYSSHIQI